MANGIVSVHAGIYVMGIYAIMLPSSGFSVAHSKDKPIYKGYSLFNTTKRITLLFIVWSSQST